MILRLSLAALRLIARLVPARDRGSWRREWEAELLNRRTRLASRERLTRQHEVDMLRRVLGSFHDAAWLRRQFTRDADLVHDMRYGARLLRRNPGFALLTVTVLALGMGATTGIYSVADALLVRQLPYRDPEQIVLLFEAPIANRDAIEGVAPANFIDWQDQLRSLAVMASAEPTGYTYTGGDEPVSMPGTRVSSGFFETFGLNAMYGRTFTADEYTNGRNLVVVLSHGLWTERFGADRSLVGRAIQLNGRPHTVVGIMPPQFAPRLLTTFTERGVFTPKVWAAFERQMRGARYYTAVARLEPGVTIAQAQAELESVAERLARQYPRTNSGHTAQIVSLRDHLAGELRESIGLVTGAVAILLLIAMANTANLLMSRASTRAREIAMRSAVGADGGRIVRQLLAETLTIAVSGCMLGLLVASATARLVVSLSPPNIPALVNVSLNGRVLAFSTALTLLVALVVGILPAWRVSRFRFSTSLTGHTYDDTRVAPRQRGRATFVVAQVALALTLLAGGALLLRSFSSLLRTSPGFSPEGVAALQIFLPPAVRTPTHVATLFRQIVDGMRSVPGISEAGAVSVLPFLNTSGGGSSAVVIEGRPQPAPGDEPSAILTVATPGYFPAMRIPLLEGRLFTDHDGPNTQPVVLVTRSFAQRHFRDTAPVGQRLQVPVQGLPVSAEIVGVVGDVRHDALDLPASTQVFLPHSQAPAGGMIFVARTTGDPNLMMAPLRAQIRAALPNRPIYRTAAMPDLVEGTLSGRRFMLTLLVAFALLAVALAATGVYGVMSVASSQRTREFGVRLALGADRRTILRMVMRDGAVILGIGIAGGLAGAMVMGQVLRRFLFGVGPNDPLALAAVCLILAAVGAAACFVPALRATRVSPLVALRTE
jgi:putative ABC transport system permease protein